MKRSKKGPIINDPDAIERCHSYYQYAIACSIVNKCKSSVKSFKPQKSTTAEKLAEEIVINFLKNHDMLNTEKMIKEETQNQIKIRHDKDWISRKLELEDNDSYIKQILDNICPVLSTAEGEAYEAYIRRMQIIKSQSSEKTESVKSRSVQSQTYEKDPSEAADLARPPLKSSHHHHHHHGSSRTSAQPMSVAPYPVNYPQAPITSPSTVSYDFVPDKASMMSSQQGPYFQQFSPYPQPSSPSVLDPRFANAYPESFGQFMYPPSSPQSQTSRGFNAQPSAGSRFLEKAKSVREDSSLFILPENQETQQMPKSKSKAKVRNASVAARERTNDSLEWDELEHPRTEHTLNAECPFDDRIHRLLKEDPNFPGVPIPEELPLEKQIERQEILENMTKEELKKQIILMQEQQQMLLKQHSQIQSMMNTRSSVVSVPMFIPSPSPSRVQSTTNQSPRVDEQLEEFSLPRSMLQEKKKREMNLKEMEKGFGPSIPTIPDLSRTQRDSNRIIGVQGPVLDTITTTISEDFSTNDSMFDRNKLTQMNYPPKIPMSSPHSKQQFQQQMPFQPQALQIPSPQMQYQQQPPKMPQGSSYNSVNQPMQYQQEMDAMPVSAAEMPKVQIPINSAPIPATRTPETSGSSRNNETQSPTMPFVGNRRKSVDTTDSSSIKGDPLPNNMQSAQQRNRPTPIITNDSKSSSSIPMKVSGGSSVLQPNSGPDKNQKAKLSGNVTQKKQTTNKGNNGKNSAESSYYYEEEEEEEEEEYEYTYGD